MKTVENDVEGHEQCLRGIPGTSQTCWGTGDHITVWIVNSNKDGN